VAREYKKLLRVNRALCFDGLSMVLRFEGAGEAGSVKTLFFLKSFFAKS
jgi:hypothetical protein